MPLGSSYSEKKVELTDGDAAVDPTDKALVVMDEIHSMIHRGVFYSVSLYDDAVATATTKDVSIVVTAGMHLRMRAFVSGDFRGQFFTGTTLDGTPGGTILTAFNRNGFSSNVSDAVLREDPTVTTPGTGVLEQFIPGGSGGNAAGGEASTFEEVILDAGTYLLRLTNETGQTQTISAHLDFYHPSQIT